MDNCMPDCGLGCIHARIDFVTKCVKMKVISAARRVEDRVERLGVGEVSWDGNAFVLCFSPVSTSPL